MLGDASRCLRYQLRVRCQISVSLDVDVRIGTLSTRNPCLCSSDLMVLIAACLASTLTHAAPRCENELA
jgi:hypothetical protein